MAPHNANRPPARDPKVTRGGVPWLVLCLAAEAHHADPPRDPPTLEDLVAMRFADRAHLTNTLNKLFYAGCIATQRTALLTELGWKAYSAPLEPGPGALEDATVRRVLRQRPEDPMTTKVAWAVLEAWVDVHDAPDRVKKALTTLKQTRETP